jgi:hypothetical protein
MTNLKLIKAIFEVQQEIDILKRESTADAGKFSYKYTSFPIMWVALKPLLKKNGLTVIQTPVGSDGNQMGDFLQTEIYHESGEACAYHTRLIITRDDPQGYGSAITYAERYIIKTIFKIVTDDDNDATTQRLADGEMKKEWVQAYTVVAKKADPDHTVTPNEFMNFMTETYGKHPSKVMAKEHQHVLDIIKAFDTK